MPEILGLILAGGGSRRMGANKALLELDGVALIDRVAARLGPQVRKLVVAADDATHFAGRNLTVLPDALPDAGPLGGLLGGLLRAEAEGADAVVSAPCDTPFLPADLVARLTEAASGAPAGLAIAQSAGRDHFAIAFCPVRLAPSLREWLAAPDNRAIRDWLGPLEPARAAFAGTPDPFFNINTPDDLARARALLA